MSTVNRKLTSILATDCVGFSGHMEKDEEKTLDNLKACRSIIDPYIEIIGGKGGGGRKDFAQAGGTNSNKIEEAFKAITDKIS